MSEPPGEGAYLDPKKTLCWLIMASLLTAIVTIAVIHFRKEQIDRAYWIRCRSCKTFINLSVAFYAEENGLTNGQTIDQVAFSQYLATNTTSGPVTSLMNCPSGGSYSIDVVGKWPACSYTNEISYWWWDAKALRFRRESQFHNK